MATGGLRADSPILIYNVKDMNLILSTYMDSFVLLLDNVKNYIPEKEDIVDFSINK